MAEIIPKTIKHTCKITMSQADDGNNINNIYPNTNAVNRLAQEATPQMNAAFALFFLRIAMD